MREEDSGVECTSGGIFVGGIYSGNHRPRNLTVLAVGHFYTRHTVKPFFFLAKYLMLHFIIDVFPITVSLYYIW